MKSRYAVMAEMFKALGDENRIKIMEELTGGEKNAGELLETLSVTQPTLSHHMKLLCDSGIVEARKDGKWTYYSISEEGRNELIDIINSFASAGRKPSFRIEDIVISEAAAADKPAKKKATVKKSAKKKKETNQDIIEETYTPPHMVEEDKLWDEPEAFEEIEEMTEETKEEVKEESTGETRSSMPSWLF